MTPPGAPEERVDAVLHQERAHVDVRRVPRERVRVRREVVTEEVTVVVAVRREVLRVEREPLDAGTGHLAGAGTGGPGPAAAPAQPLELVLSEERPVVHLEVVPYERVRVDVRSVPTTTPVSARERREVLDVVVVDDPARPTTDPATGLPAGPADQPRSTP